MSNLNSAKDEIKELATRVIQTCNSGDDMEMTIDLIDELFSLVSKRIKAIQTNVDNDALQKIVDTRVIEGILEEFYSVATAQPQVAYLHQIAALDEQFRAALKFVQQEFLSMPVENRSESDENIQEFVQAILGSPQ